MKHDRITIGAMTMTKAQIRYKGLSTVNKEELIKVIDEHSVKRRVDRESMIESIEVACGDSKTLSLFGLGNMDFLIGQKAKDRYEHDSIIREGEDNAVAH